jgi:hypothetical protein
MACLAADGSDLRVIETAVHSSYSLAGVVRFLSSVSTTKTASSFAGSVLLALRLIRWLEPGISKKLSPAWYTRFGPSFTCDSIFPDTTLDVPVCLPSLCPMRQKERCYMMLSSEAANGSWKRTEILSGLALDALWQIP